MLLCIYLVKQLYLYACAARNELAGNMRSICTLVGTCCYVLLRSTRYYLYVLPKMLKRRLHAHGVTGGRVCVRLIRKVTHPPSQGNRAWLSCAR